MATVSEAYFFTAATLQTSDHNYNGTTCRLAAGFADHDFQCMVLLGIEPENVSSTAHRLSLRPEACLLTHGGFLWAEQGSILPRKGMKATMHH